MKRKLLFLACGLCITLGIQAQTLNEVSGTGTGTSITTGDYNSLYGDSTGSSITTGSGHTMVGMAAGKSVTTSGISTAPSAKPIGSFPGGYGNVFLGFAAGYNSTSIDNVYIGAFAGWSSTLGQGNVFIGNLAGRDNTTGLDNIFIGNRAGLLNTLGNDNTFVGDNAGQFSTTGSRNTFLGSTAGNRNSTGFQNTFIGNNSGFDNTTGYWNTALGDSALLDNSVGFRNTMLGHAAGAATEFTSNNTFVGDYAGWDNNRFNQNNGFNAHGNTYMGAQTGFTSRSGAYNSVFGMEADFTFSGTFTTGLVVENSWNVAMGYRARLEGGSNRMTLIGSWASGAADQAIAIGDSSRTSGAQSICIGSRSTVSGANSVLIGNNNSLAADNEVVIGNTATASIGGVVNWTATSDARFKSDVQENVAGLNFINRLRPVTYRMNPEAIERFHGRELSCELVDGSAEKYSTRYTGFLAQEVETAALESGYDFSGVDRPENENEAYGLRYAEFTVPLVKSVQELSAQIEELKNENQDLRSEVVERDAQIRSMQQFMEQLNARLSQLESESTVAEK